MSIVLAIDTSTEYLSLGLKYNDVVDYYIQKVGSKHSELIIEQIDKLLAKHNLRPLDLTMIAYLEGPGSFTGLRIGLSVALGISYVANILLIPVPSFMLYAQEVVEIATCTKLAVGIDARLDEIYFATIDIKTMNYITEPMLIKPQDIVFENDTQYIGTGFSVYKDKISSNILNNVIQLDHYPLALNMFNLIGKIAPIYPTYAYIANQSNQSYTQCSINESGIESLSCFNVTPMSSSGAQLLNNPIKIAFNESYAYITNQSSSPGNYTQCSVNESGIESSSCFNVTPMSSGTPLLNGSIVIAFNQNYAYIINNLGNNYTQCNVVSGLIESATCFNVTPMSSGTPLLNHPVSIAFNGSYAYITNATASYYTQCSVDSTGLIESTTCFNVTPMLSGTALLSSSYGILVNESYAYLIDNIQSNYMQCGVVSGLIESSSCFNVTPMSSGTALLSHPNGIGIYESYAYITNSSYYTQCGVVSGLIESSSCFNVTPMSSGTPLLSAPVGITFYALP